MMLDSLMIARQVANCCRGRRKQFMQCFKGWLHANYCQRVSYTCSIMHVAVLLSGRAPAIMLNSTNDGQARARRIQCWAPRRIPASISAPCASSSGASRCLLRAHLASFLSAVPHCHFTFDPLGVLQPQCMPEVTGHLHSCLPALVPPFYLPTTPWFCLKCTQKRGHALQSCD